MNTPKTLDQITVENLQKIAPEVRDVQISVGEDHAGDPAVKLIVVLSDSVPDEAIIERKFSALESWIHKVIWEEGGYEFWPYVRLLRAYELQEIGAAA
jgi:hypothetical protein